MKNIEQEGRGFALREDLAPVEVDGVERAQSRNWTFNTPGAASKQRGEFAAELALSKNKAVRDALDAAKGEG